MTGFCNRVLGMRHQLPSRLLLNGKFGTKRNGGGCTFGYTCYTILISRKASKMLTTTNQTEDTKINSTTAIQFSRHIVPNTKAGQRGRSTFSAQYKGYEIVLSDEGYNTPAWTIIIRNLTSVQVQRTFTEFMPLQGAKLQAISLIDKLICKQETQS